MNRKTHRNSRKQTTGRFLRLFSAALAAVMICALFMGALPAFASETADEDRETATDTGSVDAEEPYSEDLPAEGSLDEDPAEDGTENNGDDGADEANEASEADEADPIAEVQALIDALPTAEEFAALDEDGQLAAYMDAMDVSDLYYDELTEEEQAQVDAEKLFALLEYLAGQTEAAGGSGDIIMILGETIFDPFTSDYQTTTLDLAQLGYGTGTIVCATSDGGHTWNITLNNAVMTKDCFECIYIESGGEITSVTVTIVGKCLLRSEYNNVIVCLYADSFTLSGNGSLTLYSQVGSGLAVEASDFTISGCTLDFERTAAADLSEPGQPALYYGSFIGHSVTISNANISIGNLYESGLQLSVSDWPNDSYPVSLTISDSTVTAVCGCPAIISDAEGTSVYITNSDVVLCSTSGGTAYDGGDGALTIAGGQTVKGGSSEEDASVLADLTSDMTYAAGDFAPYAYFAVVSGADSDGACRLSELTSVDYLAFSSIAYQSNGKEGMTVREMIGDNWTRSWEDTDITYAELYAHIAGWSVLRYMSDTSTGFAAYVFTNGNNEFVIAYRGSTELSWWTLFFDADWQDDVWMAAGGMGGQVYEAILFAGEIVSQYGSDSVRFTGHSLGGALCDIAAARFSCYAESFNAAPFITNAYWHYPDEMGELFSGVDTWKEQLTDHVTEGDFVGNYGLSRKNYVIHEYVENDDGTHNLASMVVKDSDGSLTLSTKLDSYTRSGALLDSDGTFYDELYLGTSRADSCMKPNDFYKYVVYGGGASDKIYTGWRADTLIGGAGSDSLDGGHGSDVYFYFKGDGEDWIYDLSGNDTLYLMGFSDTDTLTYEADGSFVVIRYNGTAIIHIAQGRAYSILTGISLTNKFTVIREKSTGYESTNITAFLKSKTYSGRYRIACPVNIEIVDDETGETVYTLLDGEAGTGAYYTDYGYFYVFQNDDEEYEKIVDLFDGYSLRIIGTDEGTMDVNFYLFDDEGIAFESGAENIPVSGAFTATIEEDDSGNKYLLIDEDSNGVIDSRIPLMEVSGGDETENTPEDTEDESSNSPSDNASQGGGSDTVPATGDDTPLRLWISALSISALGLTATLLARRKKRIFKK